MMSVGVGVRGRGWAGDLGRAGVVTYKRVWGREDRGVDDASSSSMPPREARTGSRRGALGRRRQRRMIACREGRVFLA